MLPASLHVRSAPTPRDRPPGQVARLIRCDQSSMSSSLARRAQTNSAGGALQTQFAVVAGPIGGWTDNRFGGFATTGLRGQFALGLLLGAVWSPCVGPTLGAASMLASRGEDLGQVSLVMTAFGIGAALPLLVLGLLSREAMMAWRGRLLNAGKAGKMALGGLLLALGLMIASGLDKRIETFLVDLSPAWLTELTTRL